jgi:hypothetical protein
MKNLGKKRPQKDKDKIRKTMKKLCKLGLHYIPIQKLETHWNWQGGKSLEEYGFEFDNNLKEQVRFRAKYKCQLCNCSQIENGKQLDVHHIDYNKKNNILNNLVALCKRCHMLTNHNRKKWIVTFENIVKGEYYAYRS